MENVSGNALWENIKRAVENKELTDKQKLRRIELALQLYKSMNSMS